jgi:hypothetical protein
MPRYTFNDDRPKSSRRSTTGRKPAKKKSKPKSTPVRKAGRLSIFGRAGPPRTQKNSRSPGARAQPVAKVIEPKRMIKRGQTSWPEPVRDQPPKKTGGVMTAAEKNRQAARKKAAALKTRRAVRRRGSAN